MRPVCAGVHAPPAATLPVAFKQASRSVESNGLAALTVEARGVLAGRRADARRLRVTEVALFTGLERAVAALADRVALRVAGRPVRRVAGFTLRRVDGPVAATVVARSIAGRRVRRLALLTRVDHRVAATDDALARRTAARGGRGFALLARIDDVVAAEQTAVCVAGRRTRRFALLARRVDRAVTALERHAGNLNVRAVRAVVGRIGGCAVVVSDRDGQRLRTGHGTL